jgi:hypothetical protein
MTQLFFITLTIAAVFVCFMALRMYGDWVVINTVGGQNDDILRELGDTLKEWVVRHLTCAAGATILCIAARLFPSLHPFPGSEAILAGYGMLSLLFAALDHTLSLQVTVAIRRR